MKGLSSELIAILTVGVAVSGVVLTTTGRLNGRIDGLDARLRIVEQLVIERTGNLDTRLKVVEDGQATIRADLAGLRDETASLRDGTASLREGQMALRSDLAGLGERVARVEGLLEGLRIALDQRLPPAAD